MITPKFKKGAPDVNWYYSESREQRSQWIGERFSKEFSLCNRVLDVGCDKAALKRFLPDKIQYTGIDMSGDPDVEINLDKVEKLPFQDRGFNAVVCSDVLEHIDNIHKIFDEICRVSDRFVIITLPNPAYGVHRILFKRRYPARGESRRRYGKYLKFYGLPPEKPMDRHRWFYSYDEAIDFIMHRAERSHFTVKTIENNLLYEKLNMKRKILFKLMKYINENLIYRELIFLLERNR